MATWTDNKLDLGALGEIRVNVPNKTEGVWSWAWIVCERYMAVGRYYPTVARARSAAEAWARRAWKQMGKQLERSKP